MHMIVYEFELRAEIINIRENRRGNSACGRPVQENKHIIENRRGNSAHDQILRENQRGNCAHGRPVHESGLRIKQYKHKRNPTRQ